MIEAVTAGLKCAPEMSPHAKIMYVVFLFCRFRVKLTWSVALHLCYIASERWVISYTPPAHRANKTRGRLNNSEQQRPGRRCPELRFVQQDRH
mmetsp:Transcript_56395/g.108797  ORF Transcript_56395/g.108797 Transcript_56395/m.108797 type:complete len:93 (+) Transcript_56395:117-395(+)